MIVIAIIGILSATLYPALIGYTNRARVTGQYKSMLDMKGAIELYYSDNGIYPVTSDWTNAYACYSSPLYAKNDWIPGLVAGGYMSQLPEAQLGTPNCSEGNIFIYHGDTIGYKLLSHGPLTTSYVKLSRPDLLDPVRDGGSDVNVLETGNNLVPWAWGYWTENRYDF